MGNSDGFGSPNELQLFCPSGSTSVGLRHYVASNTTDLDLTAANVHTGEWHHAAITFQSTNSSSGVIKFYVDGALAGIDPTVTLNLPAGMTVNFGGHASPTFAVTRWFNGRLDDLALFNAALASSDITRLARRPVAYLGGASATHTIRISFAPVNHPPLLLADQGIPALYSTAEWFAASTR